MFILSPSAPNSRDLPRAFYMVSCNFVVAKLKNKTIMNKKTIITVARNNCGHHARVWNRTFALQVLTQRRMTQPWISISVNQRKAYFSLCIIKYFLNIISPNNDMKAKIDALLSAYPSIDITAMGFPRGWESEPLWQ